MCSMTVHVVDESWGVGVIRRGICVRLCTESVDSSCCGDIRCLEFSSRWSLRSRALSVRSIMVDLTRSQSSLSINHIPKISSLDLYRRNGFLS